LYGVVVRQAARTQASTSSLRSPLSVAKTEQVFRYYLEQIAAEQKARAIPKNPVAQG